MDKTVHKNFVPKIPFVGKFAYKTRIIVPPLFVAVLVVFFILQKNCPYVYGYSTLTTPLLNQYQIADNMIEESFGETNFVALIVPAGNYDKESKLLRDIDARAEVDYSMGLSNTEAMDGYMLTDKLSARQFSELLELDYEVAELLYMAYAVNDENYAKLVSGISTYSVPLIDMIMFLYEEVEEGYVTLEDDLMDTLESAYQQMNIAKEQLQGEEYSRMLIYLNLPEEGDETFAFWMKCTKWPVNIMRKGRSSSLENPPASMICARLFPGIIRSSMWSPFWLSWRCSFLPSNQPECRYC